MTDNLSSEREGKWIAQLHTLLSEANLPVQWGVVLQKAKYNLGKIVGIEVNLTPYIEDRILLEISDDTANVRKNLRNHRAALSWSKEIDQKLKSFPIVILHSPSSSGISKVIENYFLPQLFSQTKFISRYHKKSSYSHINQLFVSDDTIEADKLELAKVIVEVKKIDEIPILIVLDKLELLLNNDDVLLMLSDGIQNIIKSYQKDVKFLLVVESYFVSDLQEKLASSPYNFNIDNEQMIKMPPFPHVDVEQIIRTERPNLDEELRQDILKTVFDSGFDSKDETTRLNNLWIILNQIEQQKV